MNNTQYTDFSKLSNSSLDLNDDFQFSWSWLDNKVVEFMVKLPWVEYLISVSLALAIYSLLVKTEKTLDLSKPQIIMGTAFIVWFFNLSMLYIGWFISLHMFSLFFVIWLISLMFLK